MIKVLDKLVKRQYVPVRNHHITGAHSAWLGPIGWGRDEYTTLWVGLALPVWLTRRVMTETLVFSLVHS